MLSDPGKETSFRNGALLRKSLVEPWNAVAEPGRDGAVAPCALLLEGAPVADRITGAPSLGYVGPIATALAYLAIVEAGITLTAQRAHAAPTQMRLVASSHWQSGRKNVRS